MPPRPALHAEGEEEVGEDPRTYIYHGISVEDRLVGAV